jgi:hypothetical protein
MKSRKYSKREKMDTQLKSTTKVSMTGLLSITHAMKVKMMLQNFS